MKTPLRFLLAFLGIFSIANAQTTYQWTTIASQPSAGVGLIDGARSVARFNLPQGVVINDSGTIYVADTQNNRIRKVTAGGQVSTLVDNTGAVIVMNRPSEIAVDGAGNVYAGTYSTSNNPVIKVAVTGEVTTLAANQSVYALAVDVGGNVFFTNGHRISKISLAGVISTVVGTTSSGYVDGPAAQGLFNNPRGLAVGADGTLYVADSGNNVIRKISAAGIVSTVAGSAGDATNPTGVGGNDGTGNGARFNFPGSVGVDVAGFLYVGDGNNRIIRRVSPAGVVTTIGGTLAATGQIDGFGAAARFSSPNVSVNAQGTVVAIDSNRVVLGTLTAAAAPRVAIDQPAGAALSTGASSVSFGSGGSQVFTVKNIGLATLTLGGLSITGANAGDFAVTVSPASSLAIGASTTFTVSFTSGGVGMRTAALHVPSNDATQTPFDIALTGNTGAAQITIAPAAGGPGAAARWRVDGGAWHASGEIVSGLPPGAHTVGFSAVNGWETPASQQITVVTNQTTQATGTYVVPAGTGAVQVTLSALPSNGRWLVDDGAYNASGVTVSGLVVGQHIITFVGGIAGYIKPLPITFTVASGVTTMLSADYIAEQPTLHVEQPAGNAITSGTATMNFGTVAAWDATIKAFTLTNTGTGSLNVSTSLSGASPGDYKITTVPSSPLGEQEGTTMIVEFKPLAAGTRDATLTITSNSIAQPSFTIALTGQRAAVPDALSTWTWRNPLPQGNDMQGVAYGNGTFVAVGEAGTIMTSSNGSTWVQQARVKTSDLYDVVYGGGIFMAVGDGATVLTSPDGINWTDKTSGATFAFSRKTLLGVSYGGGRFVVVGGTAVTLFPTVGFSADNGTTWTSEPLPNTGLRWRVTYGAGLFVAVGDNGSITTSPDGVLWTERASNTSAHLNAVTFGNGTFVAYGSINRSKVTTSTDGITWTSRDVLQQSTFAGIVYGICYGNGIFVAAPDMDDGISVKGTFQTSPDGVTWTQRQNDVGHISSIVNGGGVFVAVGDHGRIYSSQDGITWTGHTSAHYDFLDVTAGPAGAVGVGLSGRIAASPDGITWNAKTSPTTEHLYGVAYGAGLYVAVGLDGTAVTSPDGNTWSTGTTGTVRDLRGVCFGGGNFMAVGESGRVITSTNGTSWTLVTLSGELTSVAYGGGQFVVTGGAVWTSSDGVTFSKRLSDSEAELGGVSYGSGRFVIGSGGAGMMVSTDGVVWSFVPTPVNGGINDITYDGQYFVAVGNYTGGFILDPEYSPSALLTSFDGLNWTRHTPPINGSLRGITSLGGVMIAVGPGVLTAGQATGLNAQESWRQTWFGTTANTGNAADLFDYDKDGLANLLEFAFNLDPTSGSSIQLPQGQITGSNFVISFATPPGVNGVTYGAEWSTTLSSNPANWAAITDTGTAGTHVFSVPIGLNKRLFVRMKVTSP